MEYIVKITTHGTDQLNMPAVQASIYGYMAINVTVKDVTNEFERLLNDATQFRQAISVAKQGFGSEEPVPTAPRTEQADRPVDVRESRPVSSPKVDAPIKQEVRRPGVVPDGQGLKKDGDTSPSDGKSKS